MARQTGISEAFKVAHESGIGATVGTQMTPEEGIDAGIIAANGKKPVGGSVMKGEDTEACGTGAANLRRREGGNVNVRRGFSRFGRRGARCMGVGACEGAIGKAGKDTRRLVCCEKRCVIARSFNFKAGKGLLF